MKIGFTGTQRGMTNSQKRKLGELLVSLHATEFHHGDCIGADEQADAIARSLGIVPDIHPPNDDKKRAFCHRRGPSRMHDPEPYLVRNKHIVNACDRLIAAPQTLVEELRSGTWSTVRYAKKTGCKGTILAP